MCSITHAIDNPFDESLAANKEDGREGEGEETRPFSLSFLSLARARNVFSRMTEDVPAPRSRYNLPQRDASTGLGVATTSRDITT